MCGIVGYVGRLDAVEILLEGLSKLEYRGYDSSGIAVHDGKQVNIFRAPGKLIELVKQLREGSPSGCLGIGHTRWATHGAPTEKNAHPHKAGRVVVVHNGILENYSQLKKNLQKRGRHFISDTDTEVFAHLIDEHLDSGSLEQAVTKALHEVHGTYALVVISTKDAGKIVVARNASPLVIGLGEKENLVASDIPALLGHTREVVFLDDHQVATITAESVKIRTLSFKEVSLRSKRIDWTPLMAEKGGYKHFMLKEIHEQPRALADTLAGRLHPDHRDVNLDQVTFTEADLKRFQRIVIVACGTSWHAGLVGKFLLEKMARIPVEVDLASEFRYREPILRQEDLVVAISQSGETADTLAAAREALDCQASVMAICNVLESSIPRVCNQVLYTHAGPEIGVASTKAFITQIASLFLLAVRLGKVRGVLDSKAVMKHLDALSHAPEVLEEVLETGAQIEKIARVYSSARDFLYVARGINYPIALEGALKLKEISYIHAEGYPAGELKHGPIALIDENMPVVAIATQNPSYEKVLANLAEIKAREGRLIVLCSPKDGQVASLSEHCISLPETTPEVEPIINVLPLQLLAYHVADFNGTDVDQPRNLAKSVTVE